MSVYEEIQAERATQDAKWGGPDRDDKHDASDWIYYLEKHLQRADMQVDDGRVEDPTIYRRQLMRVAALCVAAIESFDRKSEAAK